MTISHFNKLEKELEYIYLKVAKKDFTNGCKIIYHPFKNGILKDYQYITTTILTSKVNKDDLFVNPIYHYFTPVRIKRFQITKVIGHPVKFGNIIDFLEKELNLDLLGTEILETLINDWKDKDKPIESQNEYLIKFIYNIFNNGI